MQKHPVFSCCLKSTVGTEFALHIPSRRLSIYKFCRVT
jgi:hypothetical protein